MTVNNASMQSLVDYIWNKKYRFTTDKSIGDTKMRIAAAAAQAESNPAAWTDPFYDLMNVFLPGGRVINSLGTDRKKTTSFNCFVSQTLADSMDGIFDSLHKAALTMQAGGGVGFDFSTLRPKGAAVKGVGSNSSGPISFMRTFDAMCKTISSAGHRRGAMMAVMRCDHPDIEDFVTAKRGEVNEALKNFNLSVLVTDAFMTAIKENREWNLVFGGTIYRTISARTLWDLILKNNYDYAEPGVIFIDRVNRMNNLYWLEEIRATNPCGEQPLPPNGACNLGSINLISYVRDPFSQEALFDFNAFGGDVATAVRYLDDIIDVAHIPLKEQRDEVKSKRRIGLGVTGLGDMLWMMGLPYGSKEAVSFCKSLACFMRDHAYKASISLAVEKGAFPLFDAEKYLDGEFIKSLPDSIRDDIRSYGIRNSHILSIAPTGTTSLLWGNISSGVEPILYLTANREISEGGDGKKIKVSIEDHAYGLWKSIKGTDVNPDVLIASQIPARGHIDIMAAFQEFFDASISKTISFDANTSFEDFAETYLYAYEAGVKGCTVYRPSGKIGEVVSAKEDGYVQPLPVPEDRVKHATRINIPDEGVYEVEVTIVDGHPREVWMHAPLENRYAALFEAIARLASILLRANIDPGQILKQIKKANLSSGFVSSPLAFLERALTRIMGNIGVKHGMSAGRGCPKCGSEIVMEESCVHCTACDWSRCS